MATTSGLAVVDAAAGDRIVLGGLLAVGPCLAAVSGRPRIVAAIGLYALALISLLAWWPDRIWGTQHHLLYLLATTGVTAVSVVVARQVRALQRAESRAQGHRRAFAAIVEHSEDAIIAVDLDGTITGWNGGAQEMYGYGAGEMIGASSLAFHSRVRPADADVSDAHDVRARILGGERHVRYDNRRRYRGGRVMDVSMTVSAILDEDGTVVGISSICRDISATRKAEQARRAAEERSQQAQRMASLGQFAAGVAHDFNNLLGIILNYTAFAAERAGDIADDAITADLARVRVAAERAVGLTRQLLTFTREDTVRPELLDGFRGFFPPEEVQGRWGCDSNTALRRNVSNRLSALAGRPTGDIIVGRPIHPLLDVYKALHAEAPNAKIYVGGYSLLFGMNANRYQRNSLAPSRLVCPVGNLGLLPYTVDYRDALFIDTLARRLDNTIMETVRNAKAAGINITYVAPKRFDGHGLCDNKEPWIRGADIVDNKPAPSSFHPTRDGQQSGYTRDFLAVIGRR